MDQRRRATACALAIISLASSASCVRKPPEPVRRSSIPPPFARAAASMPSAGPSSAPPLELVGEIAFVSDRAGAGAQLYAMNADGTGIAQLTEGGLSHIHPSWSPDGRRLAFAATAGDIATGDLNLFVIDPDGSIRRLTSGPSRDGAPSWSPDGREIAFESSDGGEPSVTLIDENGGRPTRFASGAAPTYQPDWSPDGHSIALALRVPHCSRPDDACEQHIVAVDVRSARATVLTRGMAHDAQPAWSPDGRRIAFTSDRGGGSVDVWLMNADGSHLRRLTTSQGADLGPVWSPDGRRIAFTSDRDGNYEVYVMPSRGGRQVNITNDPAASDVTPSWRGNPRA
jgi:Tol biopolymer transport system component